VLQLRFLQQRYDYESLLSEEGQVPQNVYTKLFQRVLHTSYGIQMDDGKLQDLKPTW
jgi:hypothetical protein